MRRHSLILGNPNARRGAVVRQVAARLRNMLDQQAGVGDVVTCAMTDFSVEPRADEAALVQGWVDSWWTPGCEYRGRVYVLSGDGGLRKAVLALSPHPEVRACVEFAMLPMGNANVMARQFGIAVDHPDRALAQMSDLVATPMDVGTLGGEPSFLLMVDVGYLARVVHRVDRTRGQWPKLYRRFGDSVYAWSGVVEMLWSKDAGLDVEIDGAAVLRGAHSLSITNVGVYAKSWALCPDANPGDGELDYCAVQRGMQLPGFLIRAARRAGAKGLHGRGRAFVVRAAAGATRGFRCQVDGDPMPGDLQSLEVGVLPGFYSFLVPRPA